MQADLPTSAWATGAEAVLGELRVDPSRGLGEPAVVSRRRRFGRNQLQAAKQRGVVSILAEQFKSIVVVLLVIAGAVAMLFANFAEALAIFAVLVVNGALGFFTEWRAVRSMESLRKFAQITCTVLRDGKAQRIAAKDLVPGDIVPFEAGDLVPADLRLFAVAKLAVDEAALTGESLPVDKHTAALDVETLVLDRENMAYKGTAVTRGSGAGVVVATGMRTEFGKIFAQVSAAESSQTPLEKRLDALGARLAWIVIAIGILIAIGGVFAGRDAVLAIEVAIALSVAAIPEGLPIVATIALARGMWRMAQRNALVTKLSAVETLGATSVILTDKTGTLTENRMALTTVLLPDACIEMARVDDASAAQLDALLTIAALCNNAVLRAEGNGNGQTLGDPTEVALLVAAAQRDIRRESLLEQYPELREDPFDPDSKRMATVHGHGAAFISAVKGAPEVVLAACSSVHGPKGPLPITDRERQHWFGRVTELSGRGLRTIAVASKSLASIDADVYSNLVLHGVVGLEDPARHGVSDAIRRCRGAGVTVVMVTGDHAATASNIAKRVGIIAAPTDTSQHLEGENVDRLLAAGDFRQVLAARVFSRVTPEQKLKLIDLYQRQGHVVAMTGDGVNDAPALKKADIGVAMGIRGTAVAKEAADMVLQDDDFGTIVAAIDGGRAIFENIRKFVVYLLSCNVSEVLVVSLATIVNSPLPLLPLQILFLNLVTDVFPALALGVGPGRSTLMQDRPRPSAEGILTRTGWMAIGLYGAVMAMVVLAAMAIAMRYLDFDHKRAMTVAFCTLALSQLWHVFNMRGSLGHFIDNEITRNIWVWLALAICLVLTFAAVYVPVLSDVMQLTDPGLRGWALIGAASLIPLAAAPVVRFFSAAGAKDFARSADSVP